MKHIVPIIAAMLLAGCGCNLVGCTSGLTVIVDGAPAGPLTVEARVAGMPPDQVYTASCPVGTGCTNTVFFPEFTPRRVELTIVSASGTRLRSATATYATSQPNGSRCEPTCRNATVRVAWQ